ncbi:MULTISPECIES: nicotinamide riboside transporter PnuC [Sphingomonas]|jgi:nicotinamide mononucleotide transporter|uniref:Nicotinamide riboside transporter PnuC n=1 Tax=Sphingomonas zeae TaxID=1646122 RepID=A0A7Y6B451_9SPHN|nr:MULTISPECIES: nicotinamide riboside transporter PnuC [Sphingomonas]MBB4049895.1 nicotinamide mononucleotide transporter [Sphingomonas zeae]MDK8185849.1 nicotinamide riboside transporter PnuC [Sphingomonas zeae]MDK8215013.1 nicotinamide riboside transporter PnuC [Sphingomonas sp. UMB7805-LC452B]NUU46258.1 nicotinamide mononucleotide transporter [Sphingomonas zeae]
MTWLESIAFILGVANVTLVVRRSLWNYPVALVMVALYALLFWRERLYSDAALQLFFFVLNLYGWMVWRRSVAQAGQVTVETLSPEARLSWLAAILAASLGWGAAMAHWTDAAMPFWDAANAVASVAAQILLARRRLENWLLWVAVDLSSIALYAVKGLTLTAILYAIFLGLSLWGYREWRGRA